MFFTTSSIDVPTIPVSTNVEASICIKFKSINLLACCSVNVFPLPVGPAKSKGPIGSVFLSSLVVNILFW